jgi:hypothetical protein
MHKVYGIAAAAMHESQYPKMLAFAKIYSQTEIKLKV